MTVCRQLNYLYTKTGGCDYSEQLILDGEIEGRNWSIVEKTWHKDTRWHGGKFHYYLRVDLSEYYENYRKLFYTMTADELNAMLIVKLPVFGNVRFAVNNRSPGLWENGFNPNIWLEGRLIGFIDEADKLRAVISTGFDLEDPGFFASIVETTIRKTKPFIDRLTEIAPPGTPYHHWWGIEEPPPPRKPVPLDNGIIEIKENLCLREFQDISSFHQ